MKLFRISGYLLTRDTITRDTISKLIYRFTQPRWRWQQLHVEESSSFELDGEEKPNCDLALLARHFRAPAGLLIPVGRFTPKPGEKYRHFKEGKIVVVLDIGRHTETEEVLVVYKCVDQDHLWCRPLEMFLSEVDKEKYPDCKQKYRFEKV